MKKFRFQLVAVLTACCSLGMVSCDNEEFSSVECTEVPIVEVSTMGVWQSQTRSGGNANMPVLRFKDQQAYDAVMTELKTMDEKAILDYFAKLGFDGAYSEWHKADKELDAIFDIEDSTEVCNAIENFKEKYAVMFSFDPNDEFDVTPYLNFTDNEMSLIGNIAGFVVIGETLVGAESNLPTFNIHTYTSDVQMIQTGQTRVYTGPVEPGFKGFNNASLTISKDKFSCTMTLGRIVNGNSFAVEFITKKKVLFWKKKVKASCSMMLETISSVSTIKGLVICPEPAIVSILNVPIEAVGLNYDANVTDFTCDKCENVIGSKSFKGIQVI